jgi:ABC-type branched-subunit amino acid transport system ATPase component/ABC-type branched-subunit amino acid transport system permease subunit
LGASRIKLPALAFSPRVDLSWLCLAATLIALAAYALLYAGLYDLRFLTLVCIYAIMVLGFQFIFGHVGAVSLAQSTFFGLGGYVTGIVGVAFGFDTAILLPLSILAAVTLASLIAVPVLKLEDHYFSLATLGIGLVVQLVAVNWETLTGGLNGFSGIPPIQFLGIAIDGRLNVFLFVWVCLIAATVISVRILNSLYGLSFNLVRESPHAASSLGIDVGRMRLAAFLLSAAYGGWAGALMAHVLRVVSPENLDLSLMATCLIMTVVGGSTRPLGAIVGSLLIVFLRERFRIAQNYSLIAYTSATLIILVVAPYGIVGSIERLWTRYIRSSAPAGANAVAERIDVGGLFERPARQPPSGDRTLLSVQDVVKQFGGVRALDGVGLTVCEGEIVGLIGPNGSGKTTLINVVSGLYAADAGAVFFAGQPIADLPAHAISKLGMARTFQHIDLVDELSVIDNVAIGMFCTEMATLRAALTTLGADPRLKKARARAAALAHLLGVHEVARSRCGELPYGTRRRVEVARALAADPRLLLLDEPAAGLNEPEQTDLAQRIKRIAEAGVTVLVIEHNIIFLGALAGRLICLDRGRIIAAGSPEEVLRDPRVVEAYLGDAS